jgi:hypothetical protein
MKLQLRCKNGETHEFTLPDIEEIHRAIMWVPKGDKTARFIIIPDDVASVEVIEGS